MEERAQIEILHLEPGVGRDQLRRQVGDQTAEPVHVDHLAHHGLPFEVGRGIRQAFGNAGKGPSQRVERGPIRQRRRGGGEEVTAVEGRRGDGGRRQHDGFHFGVVEHRGNSPLSGPTKKMPVRRRRARPAPADPRIHDHQVHAAGRERCQVRPRTYAADRISPGGSRG